MIIGTFSVKDGILELSDNINSNNTVLMFDLNADYDGSKKYMETVLDHTSFDWMVIDENVWHSDIDPYMLDDFMTWSIQKNHKWVGV